MELESRNVYIDTESFKKMGLNFDHVALQNFTTLCKEGLLNHYITSVIEREVRTHIEEAIINAIDSLNNFQRKARLLKNIDTPELSKYFQPIDEVLIKNKAQSVFSNFLKESKSKLITCENISVEDLLNSYFEKKPPFGNQKKKSEFPDAISLASLASVLNDKKIYVVTGDPDYSSFCQSNKQFIYISHLGKLLDIYNRHENALTELITAEINFSENEIIEEIKISVSNMGVFNRAPWEDSDVVDFKVDSVDNLDFSIVYINEEKSIITLDFDVIYTATVSGPDFLNGIYDSKEKCVYALNTITNKATDTKSFSAEVEFYYSVVDGILKNVKREYIRLINGNDDIGVYINEYDEHWCQ